MIQKTLFALLPEEIYSCIPFEPAYRAKQMFKWLANGIESFDEMLNLPQDLRHYLEEKFCLHTSCIKKNYTDPDGTVKLQIELYDSACIEAVLLIDAEDRKTACISCQVGCAMGCTFCQTGTLGFSRNLFASEIVEQFLFLERICGKLDNLVFMGMGEPMQNLCEVRKAIQILSHPEGRNLSKRRMTLSTSGIVAGIYDLAENGPEIKLAVSLTIANEEKRKKLMPIANANSLDDLHGAIKYYTEKTHFRCTLEIPLLSGKNTDINAITELIEFAKDLSVHVNLIPWNQVENLPFEVPSKQEVRFFFEKLEKAGIPVTLRTKRGSKIDGACGQLGSR